MAAGCAGGSSKRSSIDDIVGCTEAIFREMMAILLQTKNKINAKKKRLITQINATICMKEGIPLTI